MEIKALSIWSKYIKQLDFDNQPESLVKNSQWLPGGTLNACYNCVDRHYFKNKDTVAFTVISDRKEDYDISFDNLYRNVNAYANRLLQEGVEKGDTVLVYLQNSPELIFTMLACARIGAIHSVVFSGLGKSQLDYFIHNIKPKAIIYQKNIFRRGKYIQMPGAEAFDTFNGKIIELSALKSANFVEVNPLNVPSDYPLFILHSSGTTADPKGIAHNTGGYLLGAIFSFMKIFKLKKDEVFFCTADIGWIMGHTYSVYAPLLAGQRFLLDEGSIEFPDFNRWKNIIEKYKVDVLYTSPSAVRILKQNKTTFEKRKLRLIALSGEVLDQQTHSWAKKNFLKKNGKLLNLWWQSETGSIFTDGVSIVDEHRTSVGKILPPYSAKIRNGELVINSNFPSKFQYQLIGGKKFKSNFKWLKTGDAAESVKGLLFINGRKDDLIVSASHKFSPVQIENEVNKIKNVIESVAYGVNDTIKGKLIQINVVSNSNKRDVIKQEILKRLRSNIGPIATVKDICFVDRVDKTKSGKIIRRSNQTDVLFQKLLR